MEELWSYINAPMANFLRVLGAAPILLYTFTRFSAV